MPYTSKKDLFFYVPFHMKSDPADPLVYARFYSETESYYVLEWEGCMWYGLVIGSESVERTYFEITEDMKWDSSFTPCPLSVIQQYVERL